MKINMLEYESIIKKLSELDKRKIELMSCSNEKDYLDRYKKACEILKIKYIPVKIILEDQDESSNNISKKQLQSYLILNLSDEYSELVLNFDNPPEFELSENKLQDLLQNKLTFEQRKFLEAKLDLCRNLEKRKFWRKALALVLFHNKKIEYKTIENNIHQYILTSDYSLEGLEYIWNKIEFKKEILDKTEFNGQCFKVYWNSIYEKIRSYYETK